MKRDSLIRQAADADKERILAKIQPMECGCWALAGSPRSDGYSKCSVSRQSVLAHRAIYILLGNDLPDCLDLDHQCRNRWCVNPDDVEPATRKVNVLRGVGPTAVNARKTHCELGHPLSGDNLAKDATRRCRICRNVGSLARHHRWMADPVYRERRRLRSERNRIKAREAKKKESTDDH